MNRRLTPEELGSKYGFRPVSRDGSPVPPQPVPDATPVEQVATEPEWETWWLPEPVAAWCEAVHVAFDVPRVMPIAAALCAASVMLQGKARVRIKPGWEEPLSLFWLVFAPTAAMKSGVVTLAARPIYALQDRLELENEPVARSARRKRKLLEAKLKNLQSKTTPEAAITPQLDVFHQNYSESRDERRDLIHQLDDELHATTIPSSPRWLYDDLNPALVLTKMRRNLDAEGVARMAVLDAEGTFMSNLLGRHSGHVDVSSLLKGYTGERINKARASRTSDTEVDTVLPHAYLTLCLMAQPHILDQMKAVSELADNGLMGRCIVTQVTSANRLPPADAPPIPEAVQAAYESWVHGLARVPSDTVIDLSEHWSPNGALRRLYGQIDADIGKGDGAVGWSKRSLGRVCRILALVSLSPLSPLSPGGGGGPVWVERTRGEIIIDYLSLSLYSRVLSQSQALEPTADPLPALIHTALTRLGQWTVGTVSLRQIMRWLKVRKDLCLTVTDALLESGHLALESEVRRGNRTVTVNYTILTTDPLGVSRPRPSLVPEPGEGPHAAPHEDDAPPSEPYQDGPRDDMGPPPDPSEYS